MKLSPSVNWSSFLFLLFLLLNSNKRFFLHDHKRCTEVNTVILIGSNILLLKMAACIDPIWLPMLPATFIEICSFQNFPSFPMFSATNKWSVVNVLLLYRVFNWIGKEIHQIQIVWARIENYYTELTWKGSDILSCTMFSINQFSHYDKVRRWTITN